jgi:hypothetical protein
MIDKTPAKVWTEDFMSGLLEKFSDESVEVESEERPRNTRK